MFQNIQQIFLTGKIAENFYLERLPPKFFAPKAKVFCLGKKKNKETERKSKFLLNFLIIKIFLSNRNHFVQDILKKLSTFSFKPQNYIDLNYKKINLKRQEISFPHFFSSSLVHSLCIKPHIDSC